MISVLFLFLFLFLYIYYRFLLVLVIFYLYLCVFLFLYTGVRFRSMFHFDSFSSGMVVLSLIVVITIVKVGIFEVSYDNRWLKLVFLILLLLFSLLGSFLFSSFIC